MIHISIAIESLNVFNLHTQVDIGVVSGTTFFVSRNTSGGHRWGNKMKENVIKAAVLIMGLIKGAYEKHEKLKTIFKFEPHVLLKI